jgi:hypothetical protein
MSKVVFLDYDGVVNTPMWDESGTKCNYSFPSDNKVNNFQAVQWLSEACQKFGFGIVITSTWRRRDNYKDCLINGGLRSEINILGRTPYLYGKTRGEEIREYLNNHPEITDYIIVDDDEDMMPEQLPHFIQTDGYTGFNLHDFEKFEKMVENQFCKCEV